MKRIVFILFTIYSSLLYSQDYVKKMRGSYKITNNLQVVDTVHIGTDSVVRDKFQIDSLIWFNPKYSIISIGHNSTITSIDTTEPTGWNVRGESVIIGDSCARLTKGIARSVVIGKFAGDSAEYLNKQILIGYGVARKTKRAKGGNIYIGFKLATEDTNSYGNIIVGNNALTTSLDGGYYNLGIGASIFRFAEKPTRNIGIGGSVMQHLNGDEYNIGIGIGSMRDASNINNNICVGTRTMASSHDADYNIAIGYEALINNLVDKNIGIGYRALYRNTIGISNISMGNYSLYGNNKGNSNISIGSYSLYLDDKGMYNISIGNNSLYRVRGSNRNISIGNSSMFLPNRADDNIAIGYYVMRNGNRVYRNIAIGTYSLYNSGNAYDNIVIGYYSGQDMKGYRNIAIGKYVMQHPGSYSNNISMGYYSSQNIKGNTNISIGYYSTSNMYGNNNISIGNSSSRYANGSYNLSLGQNAMYNGRGSYNILLGHSSGLLVNGDRNIVLGYKAGYSLNGSNNVLLGYEAGYRAGSGNVMIGYMAGYREKGNNKLYIDNSSTTKPLIYGDFYSDLLIFNTRRLGVATSNPRGLFDVNNSFYADNGYIYIRRTRGSSIEGGEIRLDGANYTSWYIDVYKGYYRLHHSGKEYFIVSSDGKIGIGYGSGDELYKKVNIRGDLLVTGNIYYDPNNTYYKPDYVFDDSYNKRYSIDYIEEFIKNNKHLPWVTSANDEENSGVNITRMSYEMLETIENLQLQIIDLNKKVKELREQLKKCRYDEKD